MSIHAINIDQGKFVRTFIGLFDTALADFVLIFLTSLLRWLALLLFQDSVLGPFSGSFRFYPDDPQIYMPPPPPLLLHDYPKRTKSPFSLSVSRLLETNHDSSPPALIVSLFLWLYDAKLSSLPLSCLALVLLILSE